MDSEKILSRLVQIGTVSDVDNSKRRARVILKETGHQRHLTHALTEFTGLDPDGITFDIFVSAYLGVDPMTEVVKIWNYERSGTAVPLTIGTHAYGKYRWSIKSHKMKAQTFDKRGDITSATISLTLQEYI